MNAESTAATDDIEQVATTAGTPGELLRAQREQRHLSVQQAAEDLHLDVRLVEALEKNDFEALGPPVYAKGHLRKYAALLGLSPDLVMARYQMLAGAPPVTIAIPMTASSPRHRRRGGLASVPKPIVVSFFARCFLRLSEIGFGDESTSRSSGPSRIGSQAHLPLATVGMLFGPIMLRSWGPPPKNIPQVPSPMELPIRLRMTPCHFA